MKTYHLGHSRGIKLTRWTIADTYSDFIEGSRETISVHIRKELAQRAARFMEPATPLAVIEPAPGVLPDYFCVANFVSYSPAHSDDDMSGSHLYVCWFINDTSKSLDEIIESILPLIDWNLSEDFDLF